MAERFHVIDIPSESDDENLSDEEYYYRDNRGKDPLYIPDSDESSDSSARAGSDKEDQIQPSTNKVPIGTLKKKNYKWVAGHRQYNEDNYVFLGDTSLPDEIKCLKTPAELFNYFFTSEMVAHIVAESNRYANSKQKQPTLTELDVQQFLGILVFMSVIQYPTTRHYWKTGYEFEPIAKTMTCNRFEEIKRFTHFVDNTSILAQGDPRYDKLQKIRPFLSMVRERLLTVPKEEYLAVDEQIIPTKTRQSSLKQYNPKKPHKWGYKVYVLSGVSGFSYDFDLYAGKQSDVVRDDQKNLGTSSNVVFRLTQTISEHLNYKVFFDNWFTSLDLMVEMDKKGILPLGTVRANRLPGANLPSQKDLCKKGRGSSVELETTVNEQVVTAVSWLDNKVVNMCSTYVGVNPTGTVQRFNRKKKCYEELTCPRAVLLYNRHMGGVDTLDSMLGYYRIKVRSKKWYMRVYFHMIDLIAVNSWLLWRRLNEDAYIPLLDFKLLIAEVLTQRDAPIYTPTTRGRPTGSQDEPGPSARKSRKRLVMPPREVAEDGFQHLPDWTDERQVCKNIGCKGKSYIWCLKCKAHLCLNKNRNCFMEYHVSS